MEVNELCFEIHQAVSQSPDRPTCQWKINLWFKFTLLKIVTLDVIEVWWPRRCRRDHLGKPVLKYGTVQLFLNTGIYMFLLMGQELATEFRLFTRLNRRAGETGRYVYPGLFTMLTHSVVILVTRYFPVTFFIFREM